jgi:DNA-directed RNA polymerase specialized sigma24 family protein
LFDHVRTAYTEPVPLTDELVFLANAFDIRAVEDVLTDVRPAVHRLAVALTGNERLGGLLARRTLQQSLRFVQTWRDAADVQRWFYHHTILATRPYADRPPPPDRDALLPPALAGSPRAVAFVKALRGLSPQQREAYLLTHGEQLPPRPMATAMDFSLDASATHLAHAARTLRAIAADDYPALELAIATRYAELTPTGAETLSLVRKTIRRHVWPRRLKVFFAATLLIALLAGIAWVVWTFYPLIEI